MPKRQKIHPMGDRVVVEREEVKTTKGGIYLPETAKEKPKVGTVVAVGPGRVDNKGKVHPVGVNVGDRVLFSSYGGTEYKVEEHELLILSEEDLLAVFSE
ncbi:MAG TPA: co-chaperone GroES [Chlamydiales bacterium]|nr:co-chaperone GroES [Chlamydiales bacterium]